MVHKEWSSQFDLHSWIIYHRNLKNEIVHTVRTPYICTSLSNSLQSWGMPPNRNFVVLWESILTCEVVRRNSGISELKARVEAEVRPRPAYEKMEKETGSGRKDYVCYVVLQYLR